MLLIADVAEHEMRSADLQIAQAALQGVVQEYRGTAAVAEGGGGHFERDIEGERCRAAHLDLLRSARTFTAADGFPGTLEHFDGKTACGPQAQVAFSYRALEHLTLGKRLALT